MERLGKRAVEEGRRVLVDFGSGTQSAAVLLGQRDLYVPIDKERWVYSQKRGCWVENIVLDLEGVRADEVWEMVRTAVREALGCDLAGGGNRPPVWFCGCRRHPGLFRRRIHPTGTGRTRKGGDVGSGTTGTV